MKLNLPAKLLTVLGTSLFLVGCSVQPANTFKQQRESILSFAKEKKVDQKLLDNAKKSEKEIEAAVKKTGSLPSTSNYNLDLLFSDYLWYVLDHLSGLVFVKSELGNKNTPKSNVNVSEKTKEYLIDKDGEILDGGNITGHEHIHENDGKPHKHEDEKEIVIGRALSFSNGLFLIIVDSNFDPKRTSGAEHTDTHTEHDDDEKEKKAPKLELATVAFKWKNPFPVNLFTGAFHQWRFDNNSKPWEELTKKNGGMQAYQIVDFTFKGLKNDPKKNS